MFCCNQALGGDSARTSHAPSQCPGHRLAWAGVDDLFVKRSASGRIDADEHLRVARPRQPHLNIDKRAVIERFVVLSVVECGIRPLPINVSANSHAASYD